jgi:hypothetical protein
LHRATRRQRDAKVRIHSLDFRLPTFSTQLTVTNTDGSTARQLGAKWLDGELIAYFVFDSAQAHSNATSMASRLS